MENCHLTLTRPVAINTGLALPRSSWRCLHWRARRWRYWQLCSVTPWNCCTSAAWAKTRWDTSTRPLSSPRCCMHHRHGGVLPVRPMTNVSKHLYDVLSGLVCTPPTIPRRLNWLLTGMTISLRTFSTILTVCCAYFSPGQHTDHTYNLRSHRHSLSLTVKTDCSNFLNRLLFADS